MEKTFILHMFTPEKNLSPFDVNMAVDAGWQCLVPYTQVMTEDVQALVQDAIFSRSPSGIKRTGIFIGGRDMFMALKMLEQAKASMVPPFEVSVFADPSGAFTTAAGMIAAVEKKMSEHGGLKDKQIVVLGGTGPVGMAAGILAARSGGQVTLISRTRDRAQAAAEQCMQLYPQIKLNAADGKFKEQNMENFEVILSAAAAGVQMVSADEIKKANKLLVAADVNAVPPAGVAGVDPQDNGTNIAGSPVPAMGVGALAIGNLKYQTQHQLLKQMCESDKPVYLHFEHAGEIALAHK